MNSRLFLFVIVLDNGGGRDGRKERGKEREGGELHMKVRTIVTINATEAVGTEREKGEGGREITPPLPSVPALSHSCSIRREW